MMTKKILLTGRPGCGKTTLIKRVVDELALPAAGFYTEEIRQRGERVGFKIITLSGEEAVFADVDFRTPQRLGNMGSTLLRWRPSALKHSARPCVDGNLS